MLSHSKHSALKTLYKLCVYNCITINIIQITSKQHLCVIRLNLFRYVFIVAVAASVIASVLL